MTRVFVAGMREWRRAKASGLATAARSDLRASLLSRVERSMSFTITREMEQLEKGMNFLASIGSVSPFVGLFGTVWGIMNSFQSIAESKNTSLAVVAPGIAEALFATALGLAAAIPAVIAYNKFAGDLERVGGGLKTFAQEFSTLLACHPDEGAALMGMSVNRRGGSGRRHRPMGEINVTPFVDVMLVLLIVFMVTAPLLTVGVEVDLPKTRLARSTLTPPRSSSRLSRMAGCIFRKPRLRRTGWCHGSKPFPKPTRRCGFLCVVTRRLPMAMCLA